MKQKNVLTNEQNNFKNFYQNNPQFSKLLIANAVSRFGDSIDMIAFAWLIYTITNSASWSAVIVGVNQFVSVIFQPFVGSIVESRNKKRVMVYADIMRFAAIFIFFIVNRAGMENPILFVCFTASVSLIETFRIPAGISVLPCLLKEKDYDKGISANNAISKGLELIGMLLAGTIIMAVGALRAILLDGITFLISALLITTIQYDNRSIPQQDKAANYMQMTIDGMKFLWKQKALLLICIICGLINASVIPFDSLQAAYINLYFEEKVQVLSAISIALSFGMLFGASVYQKVTRIHSNSSILGAGGIIIGLYYIAAFLITKINGNNIWNGIVLRICLIIMASFIVGIALAFMNNYVQIYFIKEVKQEFLSRISSISTTITTALSPITAFAVSILAAVLETSVIFLLCGFLTSIGFLVLSCELKRISHLEK